MIGVISHSAAYGNAAVLAEGLRRFTDVAAWFKYPDPKGFDSQTKTVKRFPDCDHYIIVGAISIGHLPVKYWKRGVTVIMTDSTYMNKPEKYHKLLSDNKWGMFAMPDLAKYSGTKNIYYQPFIIPDVDKRKVDLICHSPYCAEKELQKGTVFISAVCSKNNLPLTIIKGKTWQETIEIKASHLICVDQLFRGIGKSGLEAMLLDSVVITGEKPRCDYLPPVLWTNKKNLSRDILSVIFDKEKKERIIEHQRIWAKVNLNPEFVAGRIFETL